MEDLPIILKELQIDILDLINVHIYGSRVYGTYNDNSDYDLLIILKDDLSPGIQQTTIGNCDITIKSLQEIKTELLLNNIQRLELLWSPVLINNVDLADLFVFDQQLLRTSVATTSTKCLAYAKILWLKENNIEKSKKNIFHSIRYVYFGIQIIKHGKITDYQEANTYLYEIINDTSTDWKHFDNTYGKYAKELYKHFLTLLS